MGFRAEAMCLEKSAMCFGNGCSAAAVGVRVHVHSDPPCAQIADPKHAADDISPQVVKHQDLPYGVSILVQDGDGGGRYLVGAGVRVGMAVCGILGVV